MSHLGRPYTVADLDDDQRGDLRRVDANPRTVLAVPRRRLFLRLRLIVPTDPRRDPHDGVRKLPPRSFKLTDLGKVESQKIKQPQARAAC